MDAETRKSFEEAAEGYAESQDYAELENEMLIDDEGNTIIKIYTYDQIKYAFKIGAAHGYKEAIESKNLDFAEYLTYLQKRLDDIQILGTLEEAFRSLSNLHNELSTKFCALRDIKINDIENNR